MVSVGGASGSVSINRATLAARHEEGGTPSRLPAKNLLGECV